MRIQIEDSKSVIGKGVVNIPRKEGIGYALAEAEGDPVWLTTLKIFAAFTNFDRPSFQHTHEIV